jgi:hypothetical protein
VVISNKIDLPLQPNYGVVLEKHIKTAEPGDSVLVKILNVSVFEKSVASCQGDEFQAKTAVLPSLLSLSR